MVLDQQTEGCSLPETHFLLTLPVNSHWRFFKTQIQHMLNCDRWSTQWHNGWLGLWLLDQASGAGWLWSGKDHLPPQVHRQQVQPQVHDYRGYRLQRKTSGKWWGGCNHANPKCSMWPPWKAEMQLMLLFRCTQGPVLMGWLSETSGSICSFGTQQDRKGKAGTHLRLVLCDVGLDCDKRCKLVDSYRYILSDITCWKANIFHDFGLQVPQPHNSLLQRCHGFPADVRLDQQTKLPQRQELDEYESCRQPDLLSVIGLDATEIFWMVLSVCSCMSASVTCVKSFLLFSRSVTGQCILW